jgi:hypothetical protein
MPVFVSYVSVQPIGPIIRGPTVLDSLTLENGTDRLPQDVDPEIPFYAT